MPAADLDLLIDAARAAGEVARGFSGPATRRWEKPDGAGPVTEADLAVNDVLAKTLRPARPDYGWLSEEDPDDDARLSTPAQFIIDPIDGTRGFMDGSKIWAHALAVVRDREVTAAVVYLPMRDELFAAAAGQGATLNGAPITPSDVTALDGASVLTSRPALDAKHWPGGVPNVERHYRPSLAYRMAAVAQGRFDGMLALRECWEWDVAAGDLILREAGAAVSDRVGAPLRFNNARPMVNGVVAGGLSVHKGMLNGLTGA